MSIDESLCPNGIGLEADWTNQEHRRRYGDDEDGSDRADSEPEPTWDLRKLRCEEGEAHARSFGRGVIGRVQGPCVGFRRVVTGMATKCKEARALVVPDPHRMV